MLLSRRDSQVMLYILYDFPSNMGTITREWRETPSIPNLKSVHDFHTVWPRGSTKYLYRHPLYEFCHSFVYCYPSIVYKIHLIFFARSRPETGCLHHATSAWCFLYSEVQAAGQVYLQVDLNTVRVPDTRTA